MIRRKVATSAETPMAEKGVSIDLAELDRIVQARVTEVMETAAKAAITTTAPDGNKLRKAPQRHPSNLPCGTCGTARAYSWHPGPHWNGYAASECRLCHRAREWSAEPAGQLDYLALSFGMVEPKAGEPLLRGVCTWLEQLGCRSRGRSTFRLRCARR